MRVLCTGKLFNTADLTTHPNQTNTHTDEQIELLAKLIEYQGWRVPIIVSENSGYIVAGHGRVEAAKLLGYEQVPIAQIF